MDRVGSDRIIRFDDSSFCTVYSREKQSQKEKEKAWHGLHQI